MKNLLQDNLEGNVTFKKIFVTYYARIVYFAFQIIGDREEAEDIAQDVFLQLIKSNKEFENEEHIRNWLLRVAVNESKKLLISPFKKKVIPLDEVGEELIFEHKEESDLYYAVMELPSKYRISVYMYYYEDYSVDEIADILKVNPSTIRTQLMRAREKLRSKLQGVWTDE